MRERKVLALTDVKASEDASGSFSGYASLFGQLDSQGDIVVPGAYTDTLPEFISRGFISWAHDWDNPVATIREAKEDERGLYLVADFHSDPESQKVRARVSERIQRGKFMGLSIGYETQDSEQTSAARLLKKVKLYETGLVTVPALASAGVTEAKAKRRTKPAAADAKQYVDLEEIAPEGSYEELAEDLEDAFEATQPQGAIVEAIATFPNRVIFSLIVPPNNSGLSYAPWPEPTYWDVPYVANADDTITLGAPVQVEISASFVPTDTLGKSATRLALALKAGAHSGAKAGARNSASDAERLQQIHDLAVTNGASCDMPKALPLASHVTCLLGGARVLLDRLHAKASLRAGDGRRPGDSYAQALRDLDGMLSEVKSALSTLDTPPELALFMEFQRTRARLNGAAT